MSQLVQEAIAGLKDGEALQTNANDSIWIAHDLLARFHTNNDFQSGFAHIDAENVTTDDAEQLEQALLEALDECVAPAVRSSLLWALKSSGDPNLMPLYLAELESALRLLEVSNSVIYAALDCLNSLGEDVYEAENDVGSQSLLNIEKNRRQARKYIERLHPTMVMPFPFV